MSEHALTNCEPAEVFHYFKEISKIPRGSGNERAISDYLVAFAKGLNLDVMQDAAMNVVIKKSGTSGYENSPGVVIQGHMDMVCAKDPDSPHDFLTDPIRLRVDGDMLYATGTTLGADNGIAVAMGMALLASNDIPHPPVEFLITSNEETGMDGAYDLDPGAISCRTLINIDSEQDGVLTVSCAGGHTAIINVPVSWETLAPDLTVFTLSVEGLKGGHSGVEIHKGRANANKLLARLLEGLNAGMELTVCSVEGGSKHNAIALDARAVVGVKKQDEPLLRDWAERLEKVFRDEYKAADPGLCVKVGVPEAAPPRAMSKGSANNVIQCLYLLPNGVQSMSMDIEGLVESSLNLGVVQTKDQSVEIVSTLRSSVVSLLEDLSHTVETLAALSNGTVTREGEYPPWQYNPSSRIRGIFTAQYRRLFNEELKIEAIHAGLECAIFDDKFGGEMDMASVGPTILGAHTTEERLSIPSTQRTWTLVKNVLKALQ